MALPTRNWTININQSYSTAVVQATQYREAVWAWKDNMVSAGWTVTLSSDGTAGAGGGDNVGASDFWTSAAALGVGTTAGGGAWVVLQAPAMFTAAGGSLYILGAIADGSVNPQTFQIQGAVLPYTGGTTTSLPTTAGPETTVNTAGDNILGFAAPVAGTYHTWYSDRGDTLFFTKRDGVDAMDAFLLCYANDDMNGGGQGSHRFVFGQLQGNLFSTPAFGNGLRCFDASGRTALNTGIDIVSIMNSISGDTLDYTGSVITASVRCIADISNGVRHIGQLQDFSAPPNSGSVAASWGRTIDEEAGQLQRRVALGLMYLFVPTADLPFV